MKDILKRLLIVGIMALFISLLFIGGKQPQAEMNIGDNWMWPTDGVVTDTYGTRNGKHHGIDIAGSYGTPVYAVDEGVITKSYYSASYGHVVFVRHPSQLETVYAHLSRRTVQEGQMVGQGEVVGEMGSTGRSSGVHLHFEIHRNNWTIDKENSMDPVALLGSIQVGENVQAVFKTMKDEQVAGVMETVSPHMSIDIARYLPMSDVLLLRSAWEHEHDVSTAEVAVEEIEEMIYKVVAGDNLWDISQRYETTVEELMEVNQLQSDIIHPEQELLVVEKEKSEE